ncbi:MAG: SDR family NAD(P)-dependent oxidoreductase [Cyclobacteriaceae bacterium]|nr:SDR family NAD(P)-dependent oxidoreductase [Cyclobacteriaceae bacterium]
MATQRTVLITGATAGIGEAIARLLAGHPFRLILCGRRADRLKQLADELSARTEVHTLRFDITRRQEVAAALDSLPPEWKRIDVLVNNAGGAHGLDPIQSGNVDDWEAMIDANVKGLLYVSRGILPGMADRKSGHVINIGSIAGREVYAGGNVYCASKFAVDALSRGMRIDLNSAGVKVTQISPGLVETEFSLVRFKGDTSRAATPYQGITPLVGKDIADLVLFVLTRPDHVVVADLVVFPTAQASATVVNRANR